MIIVKVNTSESVKSVCTYNFELDETTHVLKYSFGTAGEPGVYDITSSGQILLDNWKGRVVDVSVVKTVDDTYKGRISNAFGIAFGNDYVKRDELEDFNSECFSIATIAVPFNVDEDFCGNLMVGLRYPCEDLEGFDNVNVATAKEVKPYMVKTSRSMKRRTSDQRRKRVLFCNYDPLDSISYLEVQVDTQAKIIKKLIDIVNAHQLIDDDLLCIMDTAEQFSVFTNKSTESCLDALNQKRRFRNKQKKYFEGVISKVINVNQENS